MAQAANINVEALRQLECKAPYAVVWLVISENLTRPSVFVHDPKGQFADVNVVAALRANDDFFNELGKASFMFVYRTMMRDKQPSRVKKVFKPMTRHASAHEYEHLSKFR